MSTSRFSFIFVVALLLGLFGFSQVQAVSSASLSIADSSAVEDSGTLSFRVTLSAAVAGGVTVNYNTTYGTATSGDFTPVSNGVLTFSP
ncbi:MAG: hypothetical protein D6675_09240, partial [Gemmatimonadetes bacterium]